MLIFFVHHFNVFSFRSPQFCVMIVRKFDRDNRNTINFDDFIQVCVMLKGLSEAFKNKDTNRTGTINIHYEQVRVGNDFLLLFLKGQTTSSYPYLYWQRYEKFQNLEIHCNIELSFSQWKFSQQKNCILMNLLNTENIEIQRSIPSVSHFKDKSTR